MQVLSKAGARMQQPMPVLAPNISVFQAVERITPTKIRIPLHWTPRAIMTMTRAMALMTTDLIATLSGLTGIMAAKTGAASSIVPNGTAWSSALQAGSPIGTIKSGQRSAGRNTSPMTVKGLNTWRTGLPT